MSHSFIGGAAAAIIGLLIAFINYFISKKVLIKAPEKYSLITVARQVLQIGFLALAYFVGTKIQTVDPTYVLVGAVLGMTLPMVYFTKKLLTVNELTAKDKKEKEAETDG